MAETMDTQVPTESTLSSSEVEREEAQRKAALVDQNKARNEAALAAMAASYALQPAIDYYTKVLPREFLLLPVFSENESSHFGPLPPVANKDVRLFQRALHRLQSTCEVIRQSDLLRLHVNLHYYEDRDKVSPYSGMELSQVKMLYEMLFYRMFQVCDKYLEKIERSRFRPDPAARKLHDKKIIHGIVCHGLQFMHEFETQTTDKVREELIRKIGKGRWLGPQFYMDPRFQDTQLQEELCATQRVFDNKLGGVAPPELKAASELVRTRPGQMKKQLEEPQVPAEETQSGHIHPAGDN